MIAEISIVGLLILIGWQQFSQQKERRKWMEAFMAKDLQDFKEGEAVEKRKPISEETPPGMVSEAEASQELFDKAIKKTLGRESKLEKIKGKVKRG